MMRNRWVLAVALGAVVVGACGAGDDDTSPPPTTAGAGGGTEAGSDDASGDVDEASGESDGVDVGTSAPPPATGPLTSDDGVLTIERPADGTDITISSATGLEDVEGFDRLGAYDLGPSGSTFDPPLEVVLRLDDATVAAGVGVAHVLDDGTRQPVDLVRVDDGLGFTLDGFSRIEVATVRAGEGSVTAPTSAFVDDPFTVDLTFPSHQFSLLLDRGTFEVDAPVAIAGDAFVCTEPGVGAVRHDDDILLTHPQDTQGLPEVFFPAVHYPLIFDQPVACRPRPILVPPTDHRCLVRATGEASDGCPAAEAIDAGFAFSDGSMTVDIAAIDGSESVIAAGINLEGEFRYVEFALDGVTGFAGAGFVNFTPDLTDGPTIADADGRVVLTGVPFQVDEAGAIWVTLPGGETRDGELLDPLAGRLVDVTVFVESTDGVQGTYFWDPFVAFVDQPGLVP